MAKTVLVFAPHPDDAEYFAGGTLAGFIAEGARVVIIIVSDGNKGSYTLAGEDLSAIRYEESHRACDVLGVEPPVMLDLPDFELDLLPNGYLRERFMNYIRLYRPDVLVAEDPYTLDEVHPDHRVVAWAAYEAAGFSHMTTIHPDQFDEGLRPHFIPEKYFYTTNPARINKIVDITATFETKMNALAEHKSQVAFLMESIYNQARLAGVNFQNLMGPAANDPSAAFRWSIAAKAGEVGKQANVPMGEAFHYERFHPLVEAAAQVRDD